MEIEIEGELYRLLYYKMNETTERRKKDYDNANLENAVNVMSIYDKKKLFLK